MLCIVSVCGIPQSRENRLDEKTEDFLYSMVRLSRLLEKATSGTKNAYFEL